MNTYKQQRKYHPPTGPRMKSESKKILIATAFVVAALTTTAFAGYSDSFEGPLDPAFWSAYSQSGYVVCPSSTRAHSGTHCLELVSTSTGLDKGVGVIHDFGANTYGTLSVWVYDTGADVWSANYITLQAYSAGNYMAIGAADYDLGTGQNGSTYNYGLTSETYATTIDRTQAWHKFTIASLENSLTLSIDDTVIYRGPGGHPFKFVELRLNAPSWRPAWSFQFDDFSFQESPPASESIFIHKGSADPVGVESWLQKSDGATMTGPVSNDLGLDAWLVSNPPGTWSYYYRTPTPEQTAKAAVLGWRLSARIRILSGDLPGPITFYYDDGAVSWAVCLYQNSAGDPMVELWKHGGIDPIPMTGAGSGYHDYELVYDPSTGHHSFWFDGAQVVSDFPGAWYPYDNDVVWGTCRVNPSAAHFSYVAFSYLNSDTTPPNTAPVAKCKDVNVSADSNCSATASVDDGSFDPDGDSITLTQSPPGPYPLGQTTVTLTVVDSKGASSSGTSTVTVQDTTPPTITCPRDIVLPCSVDRLVPVSFAATATDNCDSAPIITYSIAPGSGFPVGATPVVCVATDASGNQSSCTFTVTRAALGFAGFLSPIGGGDATGGSFAQPVRSFKLNSTIPVKFTVSCNGSPVVTGIHTLQAVKWSDMTDSTPPIDATPADAATIGNQFRLTSDNQWHFNLDTKATGMSAGKWQLVATLSDGSRHSVWIQIK
jgi:hypothetical protein